MAQGKWEQVEVGCAGLGSKGSRVAGGDLWRRVLGRSAMWLDGDDVAAVSSGGGPAQLLLVGREGRRRGSEEWGRRESREGSTTMSLGGQGEARHGREREREMAAACCLLLAFLRGEESKGEG